MALGVLIDTLLVRSILVPALAYDLGDGFWWPSRVARDSGSRLPEREAIPAPMP